MKTYVFLVLMVCLVSNACGQNRAGGLDSIEASHPCDDPNTPKECWECYKTLLADCRKEGQDDVRAACLQGANIFLDNCTEKEDRTNTMLPEAQTWVIGSSLERNFAWPQGSTTVEAWLQVSDRERKLDLIVEEQPDDNWIMVIDWPQINVSDSLGTLLFRWADDNGEMREGLADLVLFSADSNGNGVIDQEDYLHAVRLYWVDKIDLHTLVWILNR